MKKLALMIIKDTLRQKFRTAPKISQETTPSITQNIQNIIDHLPSCQTIGVYLPMHNEPDMTSLIAQNPNKKFALPKVINGEMIFAEYQNSDQTARNIKFPLLQEPLSHNALLPDLLIIPGLAFDLKGYRLGLGKGHYDRYLSKNHNLKTIGVCFSQNLLQRLPTEDHDCKMDYIVTEHSIIKT